MHGWRLPNYTFYKVKVKKVKIKMEFFSDLRQCVSLTSCFWHHSALKVEKQCYEKRPITPKKIVTSQNCTFVSNFRTLWNAAFCLRCLFTVTPTPVDVVVGCSVNEECPEYAACLNGACRNPCAHDDPCAPNAFCKTIFHTAKCACPDGYIGDPQIECKLPRKIEIT